MDLAKLSALEEPFPQALQVIFLFLVRMWWVALLFLHKYAQLGEVRAHICVKYLVIFYQICFIRYKL